MSLLPWSSAEETISRIEKSPELNLMITATAALEALARNSFIPGVKSRLEDYRCRFRDARDNYFESLIQSQDLEKAASLISRFPPVSKERADEEVLKLALAARKAGKKSVSVSGLTVASLKPELRPSYFEVRFLEAQEAGDETKIGEIVTSWLGYAPAAFKPRLELLRRHLQAGQYDEALLQARAMTERHQSDLPKLMSGDNTIPLHNRAYFLLQIAATDAAANLLDKIIEENPKDEWALAERARLADTSGNSTSARYYYAKLLDLTPSRTEIAKRLGQLAYAENDLTEATARYGAAWESGDLESGIFYSQLLVKDQPDRAADVARSVVDRTKDPGHLMTVAEILLNADRTTDAADAFRAALTADYNQADAIISKAHGYVEKHSGENRLPLLDLLTLVVPMRGFEPDIYRFMEAEDRAALGKKDEAKKCLEGLLSTDSKWKANVELAKIVLTEGKKEQEILVRRLESTLAEAEKAGRGVWAEISYYVALLWGASGNAEKAALRLENLIGKEFQYRDAAERLETLRARIETSSDAMVDADKTVVLSKTGEAASRYELLTILGEGGMGTVHKARDRKLDRIVAVKILNVKGEKAEDLLVREARTTAKLSHINIVSVFDVGKELGKWFIAMEYIEGPTLKDILGKGALPLADAVTVLRALLQALDTAHAASIIHRDIKPANVLIRGGAVKPENIKLTDFGLARISTESSIITRGVAAGTAAYMSPEQVRGEKVDAKTDVYACGCVFYEMLAGAPLFHGTDVWTTMYQHLNEEPGRLMANSILDDASLAHLILGFVARDPSMRPASAASALKTMQDVLGPRIGG